MDSGSRIREGLSNAVEYSIRSLANGFLKHADNEELREQIDKEEISASAFYRYQLSLIYRILFLMVIEERNLIFPANSDKTKREIYYQYYSVNHLRKLCEKLYLADQRFNDLWIALKNTFHLFESETKGKHLGLSPLAGNLFGYNAIGILNNCNLDNKILLECLRNLSVFINKKTSQKMRVNYASLNVEEFGSVYEGMLEYDPIITKQVGVYQFDLVKGSARSSSGSHYTPDELVQPLIKHSLDHIIKDRLNSSDKKPEKEKALLSIKVCDVACGSGHILLNAARRIGTELAKVRAGEDQPSPAPLRQAVRDVIKNCIYGVDINPLAVELCKVALWLEAHNPGEPLNFLDHHIKCGDAIVGLSHKEELENGIADEAFKRMPGDDKDIRAELAKRNKTERKSAEKRKIFYEHSEFGSIDRSFSDISKVFESFNRLPENSIKEIEHKRMEYNRLSSGHNRWRLKTLADIQVAQFFIPKNEANANKIVTDAEYRDFLGGRKPMQGPKVGKAMGAAQEKRFFHWFLEFPEVFSEGGFDCILGNPPFLGGKKISTNLGDHLVSWLKTKYPEKGSSDLVGYFFRRIYTLLIKGGFQSLISTNTIAQGDTRVVALEPIIKNNGTINYAIRSMRWPGLAAVEVALICIYKGHWEKEIILNNKPVLNITPYLDDSDATENPHRLIQNSNKSFQGTIVVGKGFILDDYEANKIIEKESKYKDVLFPYLNGDNLNTSPDQSPNRWIINFFDWDREYCEKNYPDCFKILEEKVKPQRDEIISRGKQIHEYDFWKYWDRRPYLYNAIDQLERVLVVAQTTKEMSFCFQPNGYVYSMMTIVFSFSHYKFFLILQSIIHECWARKYASTLETRLRYTPTDCFETFPFPQNIPKEIENQLEHIGGQYYEFRRQLMLKMQRGLTKTYNQFHNPDLREFSNDDIATISTLKSKEFQKQYGKETVNLWKHLEKTADVCTFNDTVKNIIKMRRMHKEMDEIVLKAYGWEDIDLAHDFYKVDYLPENDRVRYTISPDARKEVLKRLLKLNHEIHEQEVKAGLHAKGKTKKKQKADVPGQMKLF